MNIVKSTAAYEAWLRAQLETCGTCDEQALASKHRDMCRKGTHEFLRATFYRWAQSWTDSASVIPVVGDTHVENFGTWRDAEGRLVWGVNDFDEACELPWTSDLVRFRALERRGRAARSQSAGTLGAAVGAQ